MIFLYWSNTLYQIVWLLEETYETKKDDIKVATKF